MVKDELVKVFKYLTLDMSNAFPDAPIAKEICFIGQPVFISDQFSILRLALGSDSLQEQIADMNNKTEICKASDDIILQKMSFLGQKFEEIMKIETQKSNFLK